MYQNGYTEALYQFDVIATDWVKLNAQIKPINGRNWITISKARKWKKDNEFHFCNTVMMELELFREQFLPGLIDMCSKVDSSLQDE